jgi:hypothetical protein
MVSLDVISGKPCLYAQNPISLTFMQPLSLDFTGGSFDNDRNMSNRFYSPNLINIGRVLISDSNPLPPATGMDYLNFSFAGNYYMGNTYLSDSNPLPAINPAQMTIMGLEGRFMQATRIYPTQILYLRLILRT